MSILITSSTDMKLSEKWIEGTKVVINNMIALYMIVYVANLYGEFGFMCSLAVYVWVLMYDILLQSENNNKTGINSLDTNTVNTSRIDEPNPQCAPN